MLAQWAALSDQNSGNSAKAKKPLIESNEAREGRLRQAYEDALALCNDGETLKAKECLLLISKELNSTAVDENLTSSQRKLLESPRPLKRMRFSNEPAWIRTLRYAVNRNLGDIFLASGDDAEALRSYDLALDDDASDFIIWIRAARAACNLGLLHVARRAYEAALQIRPGHFLCKDNYAAVLCAIGDLDEDVANEAQSGLEKFDSNETIDNMTVQLLTNRHENYEKERQGSREAEAAVDTVQVGEARWMAVIDALCDTMARRLGKGNDGKTFSVGSVIRILIDGQDVDTMDVTSAGRGVRTQSRCSPPMQETGKNMSSSPASVAAQSAQNADNEVIEIAAEGREDDPAGASEKEAQDKKPVKKVSSPPPDTRRSLRQRAAEEPVVSSSDERNDEFLDIMLTLCRMATNVSFEDSPKPMEPDTSTLDKQAELTGVDVKYLEADRRDSCNTWANIISEKQESTEVVLFCKSLNKWNSGPFDALLQILNLLARKESSQFISELAQLWMHLRKYAIVHVPGTVRISICVVESLLVSGLKVKKTRSAKLEEAARLLAIVSSTLSESVIESEIDYLMLSLRCTWLFCYLNEKNSRLGEAFAHASRGLELAKNIAHKGVLVMSKDSGPEFADSETSRVIELFEARVVRLKRSSELEKATEELAIAQKGSRSSASKALAILAPSIRESVQQLGLDKWVKSHKPAPTAVSNGVDETAAKEQSSLLDAEEELESRLVVFGEACTKSRDAVGELVCHSIRLRIAIISYWARLERERAERPKKRSTQDTLNSAAGKLVNMCVQIRKYVAIVKTISTMPTFTLASPTLEKSGWCLSEAVLISCHALIALCELLCKMISVISPTTLGSSHLSASQKNQRLAFTRCILAFCRCLEVLMKLTRQPVKSCDGMTDENAREEAVVPTSQMLTICAFCLRVLANRGCCREEGTSGALIKLYMHHLSTRLRELAKMENVDPANMPRPENSMIPDGNEGNPIVIVDSDDEDAEGEGGEECFTDISYDWSAISLVRQQLAQCYRCLYRLPDLETPKYSGKQAAGLQWLEEGCRIAGQLGLSFVTGDVAPSTPKLNPEICRGVYFLYRKRLVQEFSAHQRDGSRAKLAREIISEIVDVLPDDPPKDVPSLSFSVLDSVVSAAVEEKTAGEEVFVASVAELRHNWVSMISAYEQENQANANEVTRLQLSIMYFEVYILSVVGNIAHYESEFKKNRSISRRKAPNEVVERLLAASSECVVALRCRPWSVGAWILLGRIFIELADVVLDEREMAMSTFGVCSPENLTSGEGGESGEGIMRRAEVCFGFAQALVMGTWPQEVCTRQESPSALAVYGEAHEGTSDTFCCGFGDDGDLFGALGLSNRTASRPWFCGEDHPLKDGQVETQLQKAAIHFGKSALFSLRSRESRYWYKHWNFSTLAQSDPAQIVRPLSEDAAAQVKQALVDLNEGLDVVFNPANNTAHVVDDECVTLTVVKWRRDFNLFEKQHWYYLMLRAKLKRKLGFMPQDYLADFASALIANGKLRSGTKSPTDIEPLYQLHAARAKLLLCPEKGTQEEVLNLLVQHAFNSALGGEVSKQNINSLTSLSVSRGDLLRQAIGQDILAAMQSCRGKSEVTYSEFYFKSIYYGTLMYREILGRPEKALVEITSLFRGEAAAKAIESNSDGIHRGYFYLIWNYRYTDTGSEPTVESERKLVRWRFKMLSLYGRLLREIGDRRTLAGIISRLKRRAPDDLPVDGAVLDDLILAYADITRVKILSTAPLSPTYATDCDLSFRQTWDVFVESLRLVQGVRRVRMSLNRDEPAGIEPKRLLESKRPWCQVAIANVLHLERLRWLANTKNIVFYADIASTLPFQGLPENCTADVLEMYASTMEECKQRWRLDAKLDKLLQKRVAAYCKMHTSKGSQAEVHRFNTVNDSSSVLDTPTRR